MPVEKSTLPSDSELFKIQENPILTKQTNEAREEIQEILLDLFRGLPSFSDFQKASTNKNDFFKRKIKKLNSDRIGDEKVISLKGGDLLADYQSELNKQILNKLQGGNNGIEHRNFQLAYQELYYKHVGSGKQDYRDICNASSFQKLLDNIKKNYPEIINNELDVMLGMLKDIIDRNDRAYKLKEKR